MLETYNLVDFARKVVREVVRVKIIAVFSAC